MHLFTMQSSYLSRISRVISVEKNLSSGEISDFCKEFEQFMEFYRNLCRFCSKFVWRKICVEKISVEKICVEKNYKYKFCARPVFLIYLRASPRRSCQIMREMAFEAISDLHKMPPAQEPRSWGPKFWSKISAPSSKACHHE